MFWRIFFKNKEFSLPKKAAKNELKHTAAALLTLNNTTIAIEDKETVL